MSGGGSDCSDKGFSCLVLLYILVDDQLKQLQQKEATIYEPGQKNSKSWMLHHLKGIPLQEHIKTWEIRQEPVGLQGEKVFSCSLVRFADCHKVLETISSYPSLFSPLKNEILLPQYFVPSFNLCDRKKKKFIQWLQEVQMRIVSRSLGWGGLVFFLPPVSLKKSA